LNLKCLRLLILSGLELLNLTIYINMLEWHTAEAQNRFLYAMIYHWNQIQHIHYNGILNNYCTEEQYPLVHLFICLVFPYTFENYWEFFVLFDPPKSIQLDSHSSQKRCWSIQSKHFYCLKRWWRLTDAHKSLLNKYIHRFTQNLKDILVLVM